MTHSEVEEIVAELEHFEQTNNHEAIRNDDSPQGSYRREFAHLVGNVLIYCNGFGFHPWPAVRPFFETYSVSVLPDYPAYEKMLVVAQGQTRNAASGAPITDSQIFSFFDLSRRFVNLALHMQTQIPFPEEDSRWAKHAKKQRNRAQEGPREDSDPPNMPIQTRTDIENALKEMYYSTRNLSSEAHGLAEFCDILAYFGMASSFLGYLPHPALQKKWKDVSLDDLPDERAIYVEALNKVYRLYRDVLSAGDATDHQINRMYRLTWRTRIFGKECGKRLRAIVDAVNWESR